MIVQIMQIMKIVEEAEVSPKSAKNIRNYNFVCKVGLLKTVIPMKNTGITPLFICWPPQSIQINEKQKEKQNAFDDLGCLATLRPTKRSPGAPQEHPKASQDPFKPPFLCIETPDQPQSGRY